VVVYEPLAVDRLESRAKARAALLVNNVRFVFLPWVRVEHLASKVLAMSAPGLSAAWLWEKAEQWERLQAKGPFRGGGPTSR